MLALLLTPVSPRAANACGMFVPRNLEESVPTIMQEKVLILYDSAKEQQHFVRQIHFDAGNTEFGFIVPTPDRPQVAAAKSPFKNLQRDFPFELIPRAPGGMRSKGRGEGAVGGAAPAVQVLEVKRVGKFTAFVLAATDATALKKWLADNRFQVPKNSQAWLDHYVKLKFYYVAFRYDRPAKTGRGLASETVRISFKTPHPYYPYLEPVGTRAQPQRLLSLWLVSDRDWYPVARKQGRRLVPSPARHLRPWRAGLRHEATPPRLKRSLGASGKFIPSGKKLIVQTFRDQKTQRSGWGDVLLVPKSPVKFDAAAIAKRRRLLPVLDPSLLPNDGGPR